MRVILVLMALLPLAACVQPERVILADDENACGAAQLQPLVGQSLDKFDASVAKGPVRVIGPDMAVTMDYRADRLNVLYSDDKKILSISCG